MIGNLEKLMAHILADEGGYVNNQKDPGGATKYGITLSTLRAWRGKPTDKQDVKALTIAEATDIYRANYWNVIHGDELPTGVDYTVLDYAVHSGVVKAAKVLQAAVGASIDGKVGPMTVRSAQEAEALKVINEICDGRVSFLMGLHTFPTFGKGWIRRVKRVRSIALQMVIA